MQQHVPTLQSPWKIPALLVSLLVLFSGAYYLFTAGPLAVDPPDIEQIQIALEAGDLETAVQLLGKLNQTDPENPDVQYLLAVMENMKGHPEQALIHLKKIPGFENNADLNVMAGQFCLTAHRLREAKEYLHQALQISPRQVEAIRLLANLNSVLHNPQATRNQIAILDTLGQTTAEDVLMYCVGDRARYDTYEDLQQLQDSHKKSPRDCNVIYSLFDALLSLDRTDEARELLQNSTPLQHQDDYWWLRLAAAELLIRDAKPADAIRQLSQLPAEADNLPRTWLARARAWRSLNSLSHVQSCLENAALLDPFDPEPEFLLSQLLKQTSPEKSTIALQRARALQALNVLAESIVSLDSLEEVVERLPETARQLAEIGATREAYLIVQWMKSAGYTFRDIRELYQRLENDLNASLNLSVPSRADLKPYSPVPANELKNSVAESSIVPPATDLGFQEITSQLQLDFRYELPDQKLSTVLTTLGAGVAALDYDRDGQVDLFFPQGGPPPGAADRSQDLDQLYRHNGERLRNVSTFAGIGASGFGKGVAVGDLNSDGFPDLFVSNYGVNECYLNNGDGTLVNMAKELGLLTKDWSSSAAFGDLNNDGLLDLYVVNYLSTPIEEIPPCTDDQSTLCGPLSFPAQQDRLFQNLGTGQFADVTSTTDIEVPDGKGLGVVIADFNRDQSADIFVGNDTTANRLFLNRSSEGNQKTLSFQEQGLVAGVAFSGNGRAQACMGIACEDFDQNGDLDLFVSNFVGESNTLYVNTGPAEFSDRTDASGLSQSSYSMMGWGSQFLDVNSDGQLDLVVLNGHLHSQKMLPQLYLKTDSGFRMVTDVAGGFFEKEQLGRSLSVADLNQDQVPDLVVTYRSGQPTLLQNTSHAGKRLKIRLVGRESNRDATGCWVTVVSHGQSYTRNLIGGGGYLSSNEQALFFALGPDDQQTIDNIEIHWPNGRTDEWGSIPPATELIAVESTFSSPPQLLRIQ